MRRPLTILHVVLPVTVLLLHGLPIRAVTFTNDTAISFNNTNYDGADIVVTNCTLTVDGMHLLASLQLQNGANLTHTFAADGLLENRRTITNEQHALSATNAAALSNANLVVSTIVVQDFYGLVTYANDVDYVIGMDTDGMTTLLLTTNSAIAEGSTNLVSYDVPYAPVAAGLSLTVTGDVFVAHGGTINTDGKGYGAGLGFGAGRSAGNPLSGSGAGHGGYGGQSASLDGTGKTYDSTQQPVLLGSGGGSGYGGVGGGGGGSVKLVIGGNLRVDGIVSANGANGINERSGGGSGGSIWLTCSNLSGAGVLSVNGGAGEPSQGGGGAGGIISLQFAANTFTGLTPARGGNGYVRGGAGTVYTWATNQLTGQVLVDNGGKSGMGTVLNGSQPFDLTVQGGAIISLSGLRTFGNLLVASNAWICLSNQQATATVTGNATIQAGGGIIADGTGYPGGQGLGVGKYYSYSYVYTGGGGGYGGFGASGGTTNSYGGVTYGSLTAPVDLGSGGGCYPSYGFGGSGGGAIRFNVAGMLVLDGRISADGGVGLGEGSGGGSGGSIWLTVGTLTGAGAISANGGAGNGFGVAGGGGGGGGRIAIQYGLNLFFGATSARGGGGSASGGAGTIYSLANNQSYGQVLVDNGGQSGTNTTWTSVGTVDVWIRNGAVVSTPRSQTIGNLLIASNGWLSVVNEGLGVTGNATIQAGGGIIADSTGYPGGVGPGAGRYVSTPSGYIGGGGGHGGYGAAGGAPSGYSAYGGITYGFVTAPVAWGSGGGGTPYNVGAGAGGGFIGINVTAVLQVDGRISAAGGPATTANAGGGSGGSIYLTVGTLAGSGVISANGGTGNSLGGGGSGGRIAIVYGVNDFSGMVSAYGGGGYAWGGAGTIYTKANSQSVGQVLADNGGQAGTNTSWSNTSPIDLTVRNGAVVSVPSSQTVGNLLVASNGWVNTANQTLTITGNATVQAGGGIIADGTGNTSGLGTGAGRSYGVNYDYIGGGGGYGGYGASGGVTTFAYGGNVYGSATAPVDLGSGGGGYTSTSGLSAPGGAGGGAIRLNVTGALQVDGRVSARGLAGNGPSAGGGSGGSIYLTVGTLAGAGLISANGGVGNALGGGGGGGRIAVVYTANTFSGLMSAYGGGGYAIGGAGTIYTKANSQSLGLMTVDNGGQSGTNTGLAASSTIDLTVKGGGVAAVGPLTYPPTIGTLLVASNGWLAMTISSGYPGVTVTGNATIQAGGGIIGDGTGSAGGFGPGAGRTYSGGNNAIGGGGGYGGYGASGGGTTFAYGGSTYGSVTAPVDLGSGGGGYTGTQVPPAAGGAGGGAVRLTVTGTLQVDGTVSARGLAGTGPSAGGGSGGSIYLTVGTLTGSGLISVNGGSGNAYGGGGGGGRIAISYTSANAFSGLMSAYGGGGYAAGGAGTVYTRFTPPPGGGTGLVVVDNGGQAGTNTSWVSAGTVDVTVKGGALISFPTSGSQTIGNLLVASNGWLMVASLQGAGPTLNVTGNANIQAGGGIIADGTGYPGGQGSGAGGYASTSSGYVGGGGGYGGYGAASGGSPAARGGNSSGSGIGVTAAGSGGGTYSSIYFGGPGGGAINLNVTGTLQVDGRISAVGGAALSSNMGGGSGGGITLTVGTLSGSGVIAANGGAGNGLGGGGGGGRISITYTANAFSGLMSAYGGGGYAWGGAGTIYTKASKASWGQVLADNGGRAGTNTSWTEAGTFDLTVTAGAVASPPFQGQTFGNLLVTSNGWLSLGGPQLIVRSNATVLAGGGIIADGTGFAAGQGIGAGKSAYSSTSGYVGGGGGYGGFGAASGGAIPAFGGSTYGSAIDPVFVGGSGGGYYTSSSPGGAGGGAIYITVTGALLVNGRISANGTAGVGQGTGGGSGGSIVLTAGTLVGSGTLSANGGAGNELGGGGGGGRISVQYGVNAFEGVITAWGGGGYSVGGAGTVYTKANSQTMGQMLVDNGGQNGTNTPILAYPLAFDLTVRGGAIVYPSSSYLLLSNLFINGGGSLTCLSTQTNLDVAVLRNATIDAGGAMAIDGKGFTTGAGPGFGLSSNSIGSGAGYGGSGGASSLSLGGVTYGSAQQPVDRGSGGGSGWPGINGGGEGGGAIRFTVGGILTVNGRVSAAGDAALQDDGGGGSGGSIWLTVGALAGNGTIAADGGAGELYDGGGGGGGRIAIYTPVNVFAGVVSAVGASGLFPGQHGSIYSASTPPAPQVVSTTPTGALNYAVSSFDILFSTVVNPASVSAATVALTAPGGVVVSNLTVSAVNPYIFQVSFPWQTAQGGYTITVGPQVLDLLGQPMSQVYTGAFSIVWSLVQGAVTDTNGLPVPGVVLQPDSGVASTTTDTNGLYLLSLPPTVTLHVTPSAPGLVFVPSSRTYYGVTGTVSNENYLAVSTIAPALTTQFQTNTCTLNWYGISGVTYQPLYSTNLVDWLPYYGALAGTNGPMQLLAPMGTSPIMFFRVGASD
jgi:hypothetical protein